MGRTNKQLLTFHRKISWLPAPRARACLESLSSGVSDVHPAHCDRPILLKFKFIILFYSELIFYLGIWTWTSLVAIPRANHWAMTTWYLLKLVSMRNSKNIVCPHTMQHMLIRILNLPYLIFCSFNNEIAKVLNCLSLLFWLKLQNDY